MNRRPDLDGARAHSRSPLTAEEIPHAELLGSHVRALRLRLGITKKAAAESAMVHTFTMRAIEDAIRRTRRSTLTRLAEGLVSLADPDDQEHLDAEEIVETWVRLAGPALAPESPFQARMERRARRRARRKAQGLINDAKVEQRARLLADRWLDEEAG